MDQEKFREEIVSRVRSCLISTKGKISVKQLEDDYHTLLGERIPYNKLGFRTLSDFIQSVPSLILIKAPEGFLVDARPSEQSSHISSMVSKQKSLQKKKSFKPAYKSYNHCAPVPVMTNWRPKNVSWNYRKEYQGSPRIAAVSHNQFVNRPSTYNKPSYPQPSVPSKVVVVSKPQQQTVETKKPERVVPTPISPPVTPPAPESPAKITKERPSSPSSSARKRIAKGMREIDLDRDSGNSSPTHDLTPLTVTPSNPPVSEFVRTGDAVSDLKTFVSHFKLGELEVKFTKTKPKSSKTPLVYCTIKADSQVYSSYPSDLHDEASAEKVAAQKALDDLIPKHTRRRSLLISGNEDIIARIPPMLEKHQNAVWLTQIVSDYIFKYNEQLPANWLQVVDSSPFVSIERTVGGSLLKYCKPEDVLQKGKKINVNLNAFDVSVPSNTVQFAENNRLFATVTWVTSVNEIWCQQCCTSEYDSFVEMAAAMEAFYNSNKNDATIHCKNVNPGSCYAIFHNETGWVRARALAATNKGQINCFMIDFGEEYCVGAKDVYYLKQEFAVNQAQAFVCRLAGLEELHAASADSGHLHNLMGKEVVLEMGSDERSEDLDVTIPVVMYDTDTGDSINKELISLLTIESASPALDKTVTEVYVSNIEDNGDVYVQIRNKAFNTLLKMLDELEKSISEYPPTPLPSPIMKQDSVDRLYLFKSRKTNKWVRVSILDWSPKGDLAQIYFVDYGDTDIIKINDVTMYPIDTLDDIISQYPAQAVKVRILLEALPADIVQKASKLMPDDQVILLKIVTYDSEEVPHVEFFKRSSDGALVCINKSIAMEDELKNVDSANNNGTSIRSSRLMSLVKYNESSIKNVPSGGCLRRPVLPDKNQYFGVSVPFAVNPWNFFVQPLQTLDKLTEMMEDMQNQYRDFAFSPLSIDDIIPGKIYASKHEDGRWYRTSVLKVIHSGSISVFYCDFGYYTNLSLHQLVPLDLKYMNLPYQALKAKLAGIKPIKDKWSMDDCETFKNLVTKKQFFSVLIDIEKDELYRSDSILQLLLIDTSTQEDVHIRDDLVKRGIAVYVN